MKKVFIMMLVFLSFGALKSLEIQYLIADSEMNVANAESYGIDPG